MKGSRRLLRGCTAGQAAVLNPRIKPKYTPDFMDQVRSLGRVLEMESTLNADESIQDGTKNTYISTKILGTLFRLVGPGPISLSLLLVSAPRQPFRN